MADYLMGIDNGGTVSKVAIFDTQGNQIQVSSRKVKPQFSAPGWAECDMREVWQNTAVTIQDAITKSGIAPEEIVAIGNAGHGNGLYLLDKTGNPLRPSILSIDTRADKIVSNWNDTGIIKKTRQYTFQQMWPAQPPALLAWLKQNETAVYEAIGAVLLCKDYIKYCLTGELSTDQTDISGTSLYDLQQANYDSALLEAYGIGKIAPALVSVAKSTDVIGYVTAQAAQSTGLKEGTAIVGGMFDVSACALGAGVINPGQACIIAGTWSINEVVTAEIIKDDNIFMNSIYTSNSFMTIEASATSATNLEWFINNFCAEEEQLSPGSTNIIFHPYLFGSNVQSTARAGFYGVAGWHEKKHMLRSIYEGVVYGHLSHIDKLRQAGISLDSIRLTGGGARSKVWSQMFADTIEVPVEVVNGEEVGARGAAMCAGIGVGLYKDHADAISKSVKVTRRYEPNPEATPFYLERYQEHQYIVEIMQDAWTRLSNLNTAKVHRAT
jgi:L-xylulokinase